MTYEVATPRLDPPLVAVKVPRGGSHERARADLCGHTGTTAVVTVDDASGLVRGPEHEARVVAREIDFLRWSSLAL